MLNLSKSVFNSLPVFLAACMSACSTGLIDPQGVGIGSFLQVYEGDTIITETDTSNAGMLNCPNQAYQIMQTNPALAGRVKCAAQATLAALPFSFRAHRQLTPSDGYKPSSPYLTRTLTSRACASVLAATRKMEKTIILADNCIAATSLTDRKSTVQTENRDKPFPPASLTDRLLQLEQLRRERLITEEEFISKRKAILEQL